LLVSLLTLINSPFLLSSQSELLYNHPPMKFLRSSIVFQEVPNEVCLSYEITSCPYKCDGCHSPELRENAGRTLDSSRLLSDIIKYEDFITCVLFMGGDQFRSDLNKLLALSLKNNLKTALYTGSKSVSNDILGKLIYLKTGPFVSSLGGLNSKTTNQKIIHVPSNTNLNHFFYDTK
jgi:anaerobic ribonucleoside-triphosphate reductase activating protein